MFGSIEPNKKKKEKNNQMNAFMAWSSSGKPSSSSHDGIRYNVRIQVLFWYVLFGVFHELVHVLAVKVITTTTTTTKNPVLNDGIMTILIRAMLGRACHIHVDDDDDGTSLSSWEVAFIKHSGWIVSVVIALFTMLLSRRHRHRDDLNSSGMINYCNDIQLAAIVTAFEAVCSDFFNLGTISGLNHRSSNLMYFFYCGNFGVILLSPAWTTTNHDYGKTSLTLLEKMIEITMMRGAQTGGVITWITRGGGSGSGSNSGNNKGIRSRVVNGKRTDLSKKIRAKLDREICSSGKIEPSVRCMLGHTRFATSSKATYNGTHPHRWSHPEIRHVYPLDDKSLWTTNPKITSKTFKLKSIVQSVENYITHNGDLDFYKCNGKHADLETIQHWLQGATGYDMPCTVDSAAIAGLYDILRTAGCFGLSLRYAILLGSKSSTISTENVDFLPKYKDYESLATHFETCLSEYCCEGDGMTLNQIKINKNQERTEFAKRATKKIIANYKFADSPFEDYFGVEPSFNDADADDKEAVNGSGGGDNSLFETVCTTIDAFFENDAFHAMKLFMKSAVGSFGLMTTSSMDSHYQICIAARGQPMSIAFYPDKRLICYGSEQAAVKAGMMYNKPGKRVLVTLDTSTLDESTMATNTCRFDLDDLGGEVVLLDWSKSNADPSYTPMVDVTTYQESKTTNNNVRERITPLEGNEFLLPLQADTDDPILADIQDIPRAMDEIQANWKDGGLNRITAWNLGNQLRHKLQAKIDGKLSSGTVDVLVTGCEVSLWLGEQFASDLQKSFPNLNIKAISSNKLLGVFGQELAVPSVGFPLSTKFPDLRDTIVLIVSHSGGTFAPLAVSNLLQSVTKDIFVVASEWDTQIGKQLRSMFELDDGLFSSRIFTTNIGVRPSEPCSISVAATHQLLTQIFEYMCMVVLSNVQYRNVAGAVITEKDLEILERCNNESILSFERLVGRGTDGDVATSEVERELREAGDLWADHILENARAYIMSFLYVVGTVTSGYPLVTGIAIGAGLDTEWAFYITRFIDALIYFFLPQINIIIIRLVQGRELKHRMVGRTVVIGDIPWVAQAAEAFLSKIFARSYSIAGLNVLSGNPSDHLVHRHTHRVVRGSLLICGRPDGRLTALTSAECAVNLSVNQASSIQSMGGTCESITIGHNPSKLGLTKMNIALPTYRPKFLCEQILGVMDEATARKQAAVSTRQLSISPRRGYLHRKFASVRSKSFRSMGSSFRETGEESSLNRSSHSLKGLYLGLQEQSEKQQQIDISVSKDKDSKEPVAPVAPAHKTIEEKVLESMIKEHQDTQQIRQIFDRIDKDGSGNIDLEEFVEAFKELRTGMSRDDVVKIFKEADIDESGELDYSEFSKVARLPEVDVLRKVQQSGHRDERGILQVKPSDETYFGADLVAKSSSSISSFAKGQSQHFAMELYESRIASLQRFVAMCVMFHQMGKRVQDFFPKYSFGLLGYNMERTHSIMRIATTASPVSGDAVRDQMEILRLRVRYQKAALSIARSWRLCRQRQLQKKLEQFENGDEPPSSSRTINA